MLHIPELLAPAGDMLSLKAAVENGADAVYLGVKRLSARAYASNFSLDELEQAIDYAHLRGVKVYVTVNTLIKDTEFAEAARTLQSIAAYGADAVIVQDMGLLSFLRDFLPELPVHASTQMTVHNTGSVRLLEDLGVKRIVLARELSLESIGSIRDHTQAEIEVFIHGALCICYSGQCLFSSMIGGRSGNRGYCAQPCRKQYALKKNGKEVKLQDNFLLSPKDLNTSEILPLLIEAGVSSLKIEGRMKRPEYVAGVVSIYRRLLNRYATDPAGYFVSREELRTLEQLFNRGFTHAYLSGIPRIELMNHGVPYNRGVLVGTVKGQSGRGYTSLKLSGPLNLGDGIGFSGGDFGENVTRMLCEGRQITSADKNMIVDLPLSNPVSAGTQVYRTSDASLLKSMERSFTSQTPARKVPLSLRLTAITGKHLELDIQDGENNIARIVSEYIVEPSQKNPTTKEDMEKQLLKLGNTVFYPVSVDIASSQDIFIPIRELNNIRNNAIQEMEKARTGKWKRTFEHFLFSLPAQQDQKTGKPLLSVSVNNLASLLSAVDEGVDIIYYGDENYRRYTKTELGKACNIAFSAGCMIYFATPSIVWDDEMSELESLIRKALEAGFHGVLVSNLGILKLVGQIGCNFIVDHPLNIFNHRSVSFFQKSGAEAVCLSPELTLEQVSSLSRYWNVECVVHGNLQLMVIENCIVGSLLGGKGEACCMPCRENSFAIIDEKGFEFPLSMDEHCRTHIFNSRELCLLDDISSFLKAGVRRFRIDARYMDVQKVGKVVTAYKQRINECVSREAIPHLTCKDISDKYTKGHYFRGVL
jgi:putative protease